MTRQELAALLDGREYGSEITEAEAAEAKGCGLLVVFGASGERDDCVKLRGAIDDDVGRGDICLPAGSRYVRVRPVRANWRFEVTAPHSSFHVRDRGSFGQGIVIDMKEAGCA